MRFEHLLSIAMREGDVRSHTTIGPQVEQPGQGLLASQPKVVRTQNPSWLRIKWLYETHDLCLDQGRQPLEASIGDPPMCLPICCMGYCSLMD